MLGFSLLILSITIHTIDSFYYRKPDLEPTGIQIKRDIKKKLIYEENQRSRAEHPPKPPPRRTPSPVRSQHLSVSSTSNGRSSFGFKLDDEESVSIRVGPFYLFVNLFFVVQALVLVSHLAAFKNHQVRW